MAMYFMIYHRLEEGEMRSFEDEVIGLGFEECCRILDSVELQNGEFRMGIYREGVGYKIQVTPNGDRDLTQKMIDCVVKDLHPEKVNVLPPNSGDGYELYGLKAA